MSISHGFRRRLANVTLEKLIKNGTIPRGKSVFLGTSQTLPAFLSNAWLALFRNPDECARLRAEPHLMPKAIDELLRYAGIVHTLFRRATTELDLGWVSIRRGQRVILKLGSANRDPAQFPEPDRLDLSRRITSQV
jgi:cytochrome P450